MDIIMIKKEKVERKYFSTFKWRPLGALLGLTMKNASGLQGPVQKLVSGT